MRAWRRSPLMRPGYRMQYIVTVFAALAIAATVPVAIAAGEGAYTHLSAVASHSRSTLHTVEATLDADAQSANTESKTGTAPAHWTFSGITHKATINTDAGVRAGWRVQIWVRPDGSPTDAPASRSTITIDAIGVAASILAGVTITLAIVLRVYGALLDRSRQASWGREWETLAMNRRWHRL